MKRIIILILVALILSTALFGCAETSNPTNAPVEKTQSIDTPISQSEEVEKVAFITPQRLGDGGPVDAIYSGVENACKTNNVECHVVETQRGEYEESMVAMINDGYTLIVAPFPELKDAIDSVSDQYPAVKFIHVVAANSGPNIQGVIGYEQESSFVLGAFAALMTKTKKIAFVGGVDNPDIRRYYDGFAEGIAYIDPTIEVQSSWIGSFEDPAKAKELSLVHYNSGADIVWGSGGKSILGLFEAAEEMGDGYYAMGCSVNQNDYKPGKILASHVEYYLDKGVEDAVNAALNDKFEPGLSIYNLSNGYMDVILASADLGVNIPDDVRKQVNEVSDKIKSGEIDVKSMPSFEEIREQFEK